MALAKFSHYYTRNDLLQCRMELWGNMLWYTELQRVFELGAFTHEIQKTLN
jgi:hypothetical protein